LILLEFDRAVGGSVLFDEGALGEDLEFEFVVVGHAASFEGIVHGALAVVDLRHAMCAGETVAVVAVVVERSGDFGDFGDFGEFEAEVVVLGAVEGWVESADGLIIAMAEEPEVEDHEFDQESIAAVGGLVLAGAFDCALFVAVSQKLMPRKSIL
jgi:hypothetical protein